MSNKKTQTRIKRKFNRSRARKALEEKARMMQEKLAIQEIIENLKVKHDSVEQLESKITELEKRIKEQEKTRTPTNLRTPRRSENRILLPLNIILKAMGLPGFEPGTFAA